ncbi:hypothetical protein HQ619_07805 [Burkholderia gladioli]|jgi:hypothetical protein|uniref:hypothetical protein n=1 Tax=Burkholderia gladioli TaxID=28095 RepID=UPI001560EF8A|nr:hypothetical protein [Burkholderia gladioli]NRF83830.1 hypothetical protein [Burkholderia gladioli]
MKTIILAVAVLATSGFAFAQSPATAPAPDAAQPVTQGQLIALHRDLEQLGGELSARRPSQDPFSFCYFKNEAYSLGSVRDGLVCEDVGVHMTADDGSLDRKRSDPLRWIPVSTKSQRGR